MLAERDRLTITIGRDVFDRENRHCRPNITHMPITCISRARLIAAFSTASISENALRMRIAEMAHKTYDVKCGTTIKLGRIEPDKPRHDPRIFECPTCEYSER